MKREEFEAQQQAIPDDKLVEMAQNALSKLCETGGRSLTMTVPPRVDDTDMIISELIRRFKDKQPLPPAKGAEEMIRERFGADVFENPPYYPTFAVELQQLMETFATLHAQRIADKMVSERDDDIFDKMNCLIGYLERWLNNPQSNNPPAELRSVIDEAIEYIKTREDK